MLRRPGPFHVGIMAGMAAGSGNAPTTVTEHHLVRYGSWVVCPALGAVLVLLLRLVSGWVTSLPWAPFQGVFELVAAVPDPWGLTGSLLVGAMIGFGFAGLMAQERLAVVVAPDRVELTVGRSTERIDRAGVGAVFVDGRDLVVLDGAGAEAVRKRSDLDRRELRSAFREHGYPWHDEDPHAADYQLWMADTPELSLRINTLMAARDRAVRKRDGKEATLLRAELGRHGVVVRDRDNRQYWRRTA
ncbi:hypothetical protein GCM10011581_10780 [Saccharopolyspora subtropica]|uniref:DUF308 domain-containing protein n=2 Tax=Saccharopolyspora thermophila TaxID=89367 RepID=A0A917JNU9_9PSEU|nr:hypothetical protein GCM10011581_10780 [Saccharopolyspora subtropica]